MSSSVSGSTHVQVPSPTDVRESSMRPERAMRPETAPLDRVSSAVEPRLVVLRAKTSGMPQPFVQLMVSTAHQTSQPIDFFGGGAVIARQSATISSEPIWPSSFTVRR